jgi:Enoyl-CoA hydratase/isomerase
MAGIAGTAEFVHVEADEAVATIRLDRPPMNALNGRVRDEIGAAAARLAADENVRAVVIYGVLEIERLHFAGLFATEDQRTGMRSFIENGPGKATFAGR